jgi:hypothetical protein
MRQSSARRDTGILIQIVAGFSPRSPRYKHGENAEIVAAQRADELLEQRDYEGHSVWLRIKRTIL